MPTITTRRFQDAIECIGDTLLIRPNHVSDETGCEMLGKAEFIWANQFDNVANRDFHEQTTGMEVCDQTGGSVDVFVCSVGTGGTLAGVSRALKLRNPRVTIGLADPTARRYTTITHMGNSRPRAVPSAKAVEPHESPTIWSTP